MTKPLKVYLYKQKYRKIDKKQPLYTGWLYFKNCRFQVGGWESLDNYDFFLNLRFIKKLKNEDKNDKKAKSLVAKLYKNKNATDENKQPLFKGFLYFTQSHFQISTWQDLEMRKDTITLYFSRFKNNFKKEALN